MVPSARSTLPTLLIVVFLTCAHAWKVAPRIPIKRVSIHSPSPTALRMVLSEDTKKGESIDNIERTTEKYGLEAGLFESLKEKDGGATAKDLLKKYGIAYLATSIPLAIVSFAICYTLVDAGVDVQALLAKVPGLQNAAGIDGGAAKQAGTAAIAYAAHKAASPLRFPPTVMLTPVVAKLIGKEANEAEV